MAWDPTLRAHQEWLGYIQPVGLVVSPAALLAAGVVPDRNVSARQETLRGLLTGDPPRLLDFPSFTRDLLGWREADLAGAPGGPELPESLSVPLPGEHDTLRPTYAVPDPDAPGKWLLLVAVVPPETPLDDAGPRVSGAGWHASPQARLERLLRETAVPAGLLTNGRLLRLVTAPKGESAGWLDFDLAALCEVAGRPLCSALLMLLSSERLFLVPPGERLPALLRESRKYQSLVSTRLAGQVLDALHELTRGFQAADEAAGARLLRDVLDGHPEEVYGGLLATLLRLVFVLYAEDRGLVSSDPVYVEHYSVGGLFAKLRDEAALYPDTMDQRFGAWPRLLTLFRLLHDGASHGGLAIPARHGSLFTPDAYPFLEGRPRGSRAVPGERLENAPRVSDGVLARVLENLLVLDGERISYRALDVEQIGSVYEAIMGFTLRVAEGPVVAMPNRKKGSAVDVHVDLAALLALPGADRAKRLKDEADCDLTGDPLAALKTAKSPDDVVAALGKKLSKRTPRALPAGSLYLQPTEDRRRSGSHYTPRSLTEPIVRTTLEPVLAALGESPTPAQVLGLKVCDPAMGSGAFLVETCRYLGDALLRAWDAHGGLPEIPPDEDPVLFARRQVAQLCLYGVDKNPFAVDLAKLSLWLATLAKDHPFTFLDDSLRHGDSLVGLSPGQIERFHWEEKGQQPLLASRIRAAMDAAQAKRAELETLNDADHETQEALLVEADAALADVRLAGDLVLAAFFGGKKPKEREALRVEHEALYGDVLSGRRPRGEAEGIVAGLRAGESPVYPFHLELAFPEVFARENPGFDAFVGNPPFAGKNTLRASTRDAYPEWLLETYEESHGNADLVAFFFRRAFDKLRSGGAFGLIATNTIAQGDTRGTGLRHICTHGGTTFNARRRVKWPGMAAVVVSVVHVMKGEAKGPFRLDDREVDMITAFLFHAGGHEDPKPLKENAGQSFQGSIVLGMGFTFDDSNPEATPIAEMHRLIAKDARNAERIFPYLGGEELNTSPTHAHHRYVINFGQMSEDEARAWPDLMGIIERKVKPERARLGDNPDGRRRRAFWWQWGRYTPALFDALLASTGAFACARHQPCWALSRMPANAVFSEALVVFPADSYRFFGLMQSRAHELWARFLGSSMKDDLRYTPSDCFETFPFPPSWETSLLLDAVGKQYFDSRAAVMIQNHEGLTNTYNRFHDPDELLPRHPPPPRPARRYGPRRPRRLRLDRPPPHLRVPSRL
ncbi:MAG: N-6 DNA methylase [Holophagales bacterium]|nr:N-6 DNA methylase [Holophagales bacterium]